MGEPPGTLAVIEPEATPAVGDAITCAVFDAHSMSPEVVLGTWRASAARSSASYVVGCQPAKLEEGIGLSPPVAAALEGAVDLCCELVAQMMQPVGKGKQDDPAFHGVVGALRR